MDGKNVLKIVKGEDKINEYMATDRSFNIVFINHGRDNGYIINSTQYKQHSRIIKRNIREFERQG